MAGADNIRFYTTDHLQRSILENDHRRHADLDDEVHAAAAVAELEEVDQHTDPSLVQHYGNEDDGSAAAATNSVAGAAVPSAVTAHGDDTREYNFYGRKRSWAEASGGNTSTGGRRLAPEIVPSAPEMEALPPGFRFHPTDEELVVHYLRNKVAARPLPVPIIADIDLYKFDPWDLPVKAVCGENEWYFFTPRDRKYPNGARPNRAAGSGYWKATGTDKPIMLTTTSGDPRNSSHCGGTLNQQHINPILTNSPSWSSTAVPAAASGVPNRSSSSSASSAAPAGLGFNNNISRQNSAHCSCCCTGNSSSVRHLPCLNAGHVACSSANTASCAKPVGVKKALVFYRGRPPKGLKTNWIMHEYRLADAGNQTPTAASGGSNKHSSGAGLGSSSGSSGFYSRRTLRLDDWVLCRIYRKNTQNHEQPYIQVRSDSNSCIDEVFPNAPTSDRLQVNDEANKVMKFQQYNSGMRQPNQLGSFSRLVMSGSPMLSNVNLLENFVVNDKPCSNTSTDQIVNNWGTSTSFNSNSIININGAHPLFNAREVEYETKRNNFPTTNIANNGIPNNYSMQGIPNIFSSMNALHHFQQHSNEGISREPETSHSEVIYDNNNLHWALDNRSKYPFT